MKKLIVSACLLGINCNYRGKNSLSTELLKLLDRYVLVPVCPEQLGGLETPRKCSEIKGGRGWNQNARVITQSGKDVTSEFLKGAEETLKVAVLTGASLAILKSRSPSCGSSNVYDGSFNSIIVPGSGVTAWYLRQNGIEVYNENELSFIY